jgi:Coenzyme PQQ synthesis protein D (PqqD)
MQIARSQLIALVENKLPDGSRVVVDSTNETVFALNATAGAAWDACNRPTTLSRVTKEMQRSLDPSVTEELAAEAIRQLEDQKLVETSVPLPQATRRQFIATLSVVALPLIVSLPIAEQQAFAGKARSAPSPPPKPPPPRKH